MINYQIQLPDSLKIGDFDLKMLVATKLFEDGRLSSGQACKIVGISKRAFIEVMGKYNVSLFGNNIQDLEDDFANA